MASYNLKINGKNVSVEADADTPLLWVLRDELNLVGTKFGCGIGQCGACTIHLDGVATRSCLLPASALEDSEITTIEGLADEKLTKATFKKEVLAMVDLENELLGKFIDTSMEETQRVYKEYYKDFGETKIIENPTIEQLKIELAQ